MRQSDADQCTVIGAGITLQEANKAADALAESGIMIRVIDPFTIKPLDVNTILNSAKQTRGRVVVVEDHYPEGEVLRVIYNIPLLLNEWGGYLFCCFITARKRSLRRSVHRGGRAWQGEGRAWRGGMHGRGRVRGRYYEIRSMSGRYASYWNAFLFWIMSPHKQLNVFTRLTLRKWTASDLPTRITVWCCSFQQEESEKQ